MVSNLVSGRAHLRSMLACGADRVSEVGAHLSGRKCNVIMVPRYSIFSRDLKFYYNKLSPPFLLFAYAKKLSRIGGELREKWDQNLWESWLSGGIDSNR